MELKHKFYGVGRNGNTELIRKGNVETRLELPTGLIIKSEGQMVIRSKDAATLITGYFCRRLEDTNSGTEPATYLGKNPGCCRTNKY